MIGGEVEVLFDLQQQLFEEGDAFLLKLLPLLEHLLHVLHVLRRQLVQLVKGLLVALLSLKVQTRTDRLRPGLTVSDWIKLRTRPSQSNQTRIRERVKCKLKVCLLHSVCHR